MCPVGFEPRSEISGWHDSRVNPWGWSLRRPERRFVLSLPLDAIVTHSCCQVFLAYRRLRNGILDDRPKDSGTRHLPPPVKSPKKKGLFFDSADMARCNGGLPKCGTPEPSFKRGRCAHCCTALRGSSNYHNLRRRSIALFQVCSTDPCWTSTEPTKAQMPILATLM